MFCQKMKNRCTIREIPIWNLFFTRFRDTARNINASESYFFGPSKSLPGVLKKDTFFDHVFTVMHYTLSRPVKNGSFWSTFWVPKSCIFFRFCRIFYENRKFYRKIQKRYFKMYFEKLDTLAHFD